MNKLTEKQIERKARQDRILLYISIVGYFAMSVSFLLMPLKEAGNLPGLMFWVGLTIGVVTQILLETRRRSFFASYGVARKKMQKPHNGMMTFGSNRFALIVDWFLVAAFGGTWITFVVTRGIGYSCYVFLAVTLFALCMHSILNGRNYFHIINQKRIRHLLDQRKVSSQVKEREENEK